MICLLLLTDSCVVSIKKQADFPHVAVVMLLISLRLLLPFVLLGCKSMH